MRPIPASFSGISPLPWPERRRAVMTTRVGPELMYQFSFVRCTEYTADYLYELPADKSVALMGHFIAFPDDAERMAFLHPDEQRAELTRLTEIIAHATPQDTDR